MKPNPKRFIRNFAAFAAWYLFGNRLQWKHYGEDGKPADDSITPTTNVRWLAAAGSTFIEPLIDRWDNDYAKAHELHINYLPVGSGGGIDRLRQGYGAFSVSDAPLGDDQLKGLPPIVQFPVTAGPVCIVYNLPGLKAPLGSVARRSQESMRVKS